MPGLRHAVPEDRADPVRPQPRHHDALRRPDPAEPRHRRGHHRQRRAGASDHATSRTASAAASRSPARWRNHPVFPPMVVQMMAVGEDTGALDTMLHKIAEFYDQEVEATTESLTALIEPLMIAVPRRHHRVDDHRPLHADLQDLRPDQVSTPHCVADDGPRPAPFSGAGLGRSSEPVRVNREHGTRRAVAQGAARSGPKHLIVIELHRPEKAHPSRGGVAKPGDLRDSRRSAQLPRPAPTRVPRGDRRRGSSHTVLKGRTAACSLASASRWRRRTRASP